VRRFGAFALILAVFITLLALGTWQVQRLAWKMDLIEQAETRPTLPAVPLHELVDAAGLDGPALNADDPARLAADEVAYRRVSLTGQFVGEPVRVFTALSEPNGTYEGPGYWIMQAFRTAEHTVFVNRGFIPFDLPETVQVRAAPVGTVTFEGLIRPDDLPDVFTPDPDYDQSILYRRNVAQLVEVASSGAALPITIDMPASVVPGLPQAGETKFTFSNRHLEYAVTWYALAAVLAAIVAMVLIQRRMRFV
jgi:surfeit locus 1 family protein